MGIFEKFKVGFKKSASTFTSGLKDIIIKKEIDDKTLNQIESNSILPIKQDLEKPSPAPKLKSEMFIINWNDSAYKIHNQIRAFSPKPGAFTMFNGLRIKLFNSEVDISMNLKPGNSEINENKFFIGTGEGTLIIKTVQLEGKKIMSVLDFHKGIINKIPGRVITFG